MADTDTTTAHAPRGRGHFGFACSARRGGDISGCLVPPASGGLVPSGEAAHTASTRGHAPTAGRGAPFGSCRSSGEAVMSGIGRLDRGRFGIRAGGNSLCKVRQRGSAAVDAPRRVTTSPRPRAVRRPPELGGLAFARGAVQPPARRSCRTLLRVASGVCRAFTVSRVGVMAPAASGMIDVVAWGWAIIVPVSGLGPAWRSSPTGSPPRACS